MGDLGADDGVGSLLDAGTADAGLEDPLTGWAAILGTFMLAPLAQGVS